MCMVCICIYNRQIYTYVKQNNPVGQLHSIPSPQKIFFRRPAAGDIVKHRKITLYDHHRK